MAQSPAPPEHLQEPSDVPLAPATGLERELPAEPAAPAPPVAPSTDPIAVAPSLRPEAPAALAPVPPPPEGMERRRALGDEDLERKREGHYFTGLPLVNFDPNTGVGFGARAYYFEDGKRTDPLFAYTPYLHRAFAQAFASTGGLQYHWLDWDAPNFMGSLYRLRASLRYEQNTSRQYYGIGERSMRPLAYVGNPLPFADAKDYEAELAKVRADGTTYGRYDRFFFRRPSATFAAERMLLGGIVRPMVGLGFSYTGVRTYGGTSTEGQDAQGNTVAATEGTTRLDQDCAANRIVGCAGGWDNVLRLGLSLDTRDFEPDPNHGVYAEISTELGTKALASDYDYARTLFVARGYYSPFPKFADVVLAARGLYQLQTGGTPFTSMNNMPFIEDLRTGLGGLRTLRGYRQDRFVGPVMVVTNFEIRWTFYRFKAAKQNFALGVVPFLDMGRVFDRVKDTSFAGWARGQGLGLRVAWNDATIVVVDYGRSSEDSGLYINFNHQF